MQVDGGFKKAGKKGTSAARIVFMYLHNSRFPPQVSQSLSATQLSYEQAIPSHP
jgi:hypothetical protein